MGHSFPRRKTFSPRRGISAIRNLPYTHQVYDFYQFWGFPTEPSTSLKRSKKGGIPPQPRTGLGEQFFSVFTGRKTGGAIFRTNGSNSIGKRRVFASTAFRGDGVPKRGRAVATSGKLLPTHGVRSEGAAAELFPRPRRSRHAAESADP